jgi:hypothetical protein
MSSGNSNSSSNLINHPFWSKYNNIYSKSRDIYYFGCHKTKCEMCKLWSSKYQTWRWFEFFPLHCHLCHYAGYVDDFNFFADIIILCNNCYNKGKHKISQINNINYSHQID